MTATIPASAAVAAHKSGTPVKLPVQVSAGQEISISAPKSSGEMLVELPVTDATSGMVAVIVSEDGTEEILKKSVVTEDSIVFPGTGTVVVKIVDNSKEFEDIPGDFWAADAIDFVSSRELFNGTTATTFSPNSSTTRAQLMTVLARLDGTDTSLNSLQTGMAWAVESGISDGSNPDGSISRQQLVTMLWRYAKQKGYDVSSGADTNILDYTDASDLDEYAVEAMQWACSEGIVGGYEDGSLKPLASATRAHMAVIVERFINSIV